MLKYHQTSSGDLRRLCVHSPDSVVQGFDDLFMIRLFPRGPVGIAELAYVFGCKGTEGSVVVVRRGDQTSDQRSGVGFQQIRPEIVVGRVQFCKVTTEPVS